MPNGYNADEDAPDNEAQSTPESITHLAVNEIVDQKTKGEEDWYLSSRVNELAIGIEFQFHVEGITQ